MTALSFVDRNVKRILKTAIELIPEDSEYRSVVDFAWDCCGRCADWHDALALCEDRYRKYNWIHAYPNACCLVIALYYGGGDFARTLHIVTMCGLDADCNAGVIMPVIGISQGPGAIPERYMHPAFERLTTYMRGAFSEIATEELVDRTVAAVSNALAKA